MGLFSSKRKTYVDTAVMRVVEDPQIPNSALNAVIDAIVRNRDIADSLRDNMLNGSFRNFERMYRYARDGDYFYGLPDARILSSSDGQELVAEAIEEEIGFPVTLNYSYYRPLNHEFMGWKHLSEELGYDTETNEITDLSTAKGYPVFLEKMVSVYLYDPELPPDPSSIARSRRVSAAGIKPTTPIFEEAPELIGLVAEEDIRFGPTETDSVEIHYLWEVPATYDEETHELLEPAEIHREMVVVDLWEYDPDLEYFQAEYTYHDGQGSRTGFWLYQPEDGTHPELSDVFSHNYTSPGTYFPFAIFRRERENRATTALEDTEEYRTTKKLLKFINIDFQEFSDNVHDNPDIDDIEQAVLMMAVPIVTEDPLEIEYLFQFFDRINTQLDSRRTPIQRIMQVWNSSRYIQSDSYAIEIADADFRVVLSFDSLKKHYSPAVIGPVGSVDNRVITIEDAADLPFSVFPSGIVQQNTRRIRKQITPTVCEDIFVQNLTLRYDIYKGKGVVGATEDEITLIPLDYEITKVMPALDREKLYFRSLHFVANSRISVKVRWYQTGVFKAIVTIVGIVLTIWSMGSDGGFFASLGTAIAAGATAVAVFLIKTILVQILVSAAFQLAAEAVGAEWAAVLAVVAVAYGGYKGFQTGFGKNSLATNLVKAGTGLMGGAQNALQEQMKELQVDSAEFLEMAEAMWEELEEVRALLDTKASLDPFAFIGLQPMTVFGESSENYFDRTVHSGNIGTTSFKIIENYVDLSLRLPTIQDTTGESFYV